MPTLSAAAGAFTLTPATTRVRHAKPFTLGSYAVTGATSELLYAKPFWGAAYTLTGSRATVFKRVVPPGGAFTEDRADVRIATNASSLSMPYRLGAGARLYVAVFWRATTTRTVTGVTYGGQSLDYDQTQTGLTTYCGLRTWTGLAIPGIDTEQTLLVTLDGGATELVVVASSWFGVGGFTNLGSTGNQRGTGTTSSTSITADTDELVLDAVLVNFGTNALTPTASQPSVYAGPTTALGYGLSEKLGTGASMAMAWNWSGSYDWIHQAVTVTPPGVVAPRAAAYLAMMGVNA